MAKPRTQNLLDDFKNNEINLEAQILSTKQM